MSITSYLTGMTPVPGKSTSEATGVASSAATEFPKAQVGVALPQQDGTNVTPSRYAKTILMHARTTPVWIRLGTGTGMSAAATTSGAFDIYIEAGSWYVLRRPKDYTYYRQISTGTGVLILIPQEYEQKETT